MILAVPFRVAIGRDHIFLRYPLGRNSRYVCVNRKSSKGLQWSNATIQKSLKLKFACGSGYQELIDQASRL